MIKRILYIILTVITLGGAIFLASFAGVEHRQLVYRSFSLSIDNPHEQTLITEEELLDTLHLKFGDIKGKALDDVPIFDIEQFLNTNPYVHRTNVYTTLNGDMVASVTVRMPMLRVINSFDESYIIDTAGVVMPLSAKHPVRLLVATGDINARPDTIASGVHHYKKGHALRDVYELSGLIYKDEFLDALIGQVYINEDGEMELIPKIGEQTILAGTSENAEAKMVKLKEFYLQVMKYAGWDTYQTINLTFDNQVVCSK
jgi:cell division protein FtsQ